jgi:NAD+ synthase
MNERIRYLANDMLDHWGVTPIAERDWPQEIDLRIRFLQEVLLGAGRSRLVLGISGGVDSTAAGKLCQLAIEGLRPRLPHAAFIAVRLPYGVQLDEADAQKALEFIAPDQVHTVDIQPGVDALHAAVMAMHPHMSPERADFERGNVKVRIRMTVQYEIAALNDGLVVGTDHNAEAVTGFFTKWGDGACDLLPLRGLNKRQVRRLSVALGSGLALAQKSATADLEDLRPQRLDEDALGIPYDAIDRFLEGETIAPAHLEELARQYERTAHKRCDPPAAEGAYRKAADEGT